ncbi:hypothetical protein AB0J80_03145 [Actinoplanes sp. NPDC049548]
MQHYDVMARPNNYPLLPGQVRQNSLSTVSAKGFVHFSAAIGGCHLTGPA